MRCSSGDSGVGGGDGDACCAFTIASMSKTIPPSGTDGVAAAGAFVAVEGVDGDGDGVEASIAAKSIATAPGGSAAGDDGDAAAGGGFDGVGVGGAAGTEAGNDASAAAARRFTSASASATASRRSSSTAVASPSIVSAGTMLARVGAIRSRESATA